MAARYFFSGTVEDKIGRLDGDQAHHAIQVMRFAKGDPITLFDSRGNEYFALVQQIEKKSLVFAVLEINSTEATSLPMIYLAACLPKGDRQKFMIEKLVELGVDQFIPLNGKRSVAVASVDSRKRQQKGIIEATKQCGRKRLMELSSEQSLSKLIEATADETTWTKLLADPTAESSLSDLELGTRPRVIVAVGPEGGFDDSETAALVQANWQRVRIGKSILRIETAAIAAATLLVTKRDRAFEQR